MSLDDGVAELDVQTCILFEHWPFRGCNEDDIYLLVLQGSLKEIVLDKKLINSNDKYG